MVFATSAPTEECYENMTTPHRNDTRPYPQDNGAGSRQIAGTNDRFRRSPRAPLIHSSLLSVSPPLDALFHRRNPFRNDIEFRKLFSYVRLACPALASNQTPGLRERCPPPSDSFPPLPSLPALLVPRSRPSLVRPVVKLAVNSSGPSAFPVPRCLGPIKCRSRRP